jgi:hypothetical protein
MEIGTLALPREAVERALSPYFVALLRAPSVTATVTAGPCSQGSQFKQSAVQRLAGPAGVREGAHLGAVWGIRTAVAQPLDVRLQVS